MSRRFVEHAFALLLLAGCFTTHYLVRAEYVRGDRLKGDELSYIFHSSSQYGEPLAKWFTEGTSQYFNNYPELFVPYTEYIRATISLIIYVESAVRPYLGEPAYIFGGLALFFLSFVLMHAWLVRFLGIQPVVSAVAVLLASTSPVFTASLGAAMVDQCTTAAISLLILAALSYWLSPRTGPRRIMEGMVLALPLPVDLGVRLLAFHTKVTGFYALGNLLHAPLRPLIATIAEPFTPFLPVNTDDVGRLVLRLAESEGYLTADLGYLVLLILLNLAALALAYRAWKQARPARHTLVLAVTLMVLAMQSAYTALSPEIRQRYILSIYSVCLLAYLVSRQIRAAGGKKLSTRWLPSPALLRWCTSFTFGNGIPPAYNSIGHRSRFVALSRQRCSRNPNSRCMS